MIKSGELYLVSFLPTLTYGVLRPVDLPFVLCGTVPHYYFFFYFIFLFWMSPVVAGVSSHRGAPPLPGMIMYVTQLYLVSCNYDGYP